MAIERGVIYYKLGEQQQYDGDYTKNCGLLGEEIDQNFYFLRGYDIKDVQVDENRNLIITRVDEDYEPLVVNIGEELGQPEFRFDIESGIIFVTYPDGSISKMEGFLVEGKDVKVATDGTLSGNGTIYNPLRISSGDKTGTYAPVDAYVDLTDGSSMGIGKGKGYRLVSKEKIDNFGCLYPFSAVKKIQDKLTESKSQWRVPTKADWDELLNSFECADKRNHSDVACTWLGDVAGSAVKSANLWSHHETLPTETPTEGQDIRGISIYPVGITPDRNNILNESDYDVEGFGQIAGMWTNTLNGDGNAYVKIFGYNSAKVDQDTYGDGARMSIRLCKDYNMSNYDEIETILGFPYPTELVYGIHDDFPYAKIWTKINFYSDAEMLNGIRSEQWSATSDSDRGIKTIFYVNEWDGKTWSKKPMNEGDSVVILSKDGIEYREWRLEHGELVDVAKDTKDEFVEQLNRLEERIDEEVALRVKGDADLEAKVNTEAETRKTADETLQANINAEAEIRKSGDDALQANINAEAATREAVDIEIKNSVKTETDARISADKQLQSNIDTEEAARVSADTILQTNIDAEAATRLASDNQLQSNIDAEAVTRAEADAVLQTNINVEAETRLNADATLQTNIDAEVADRIAAVAQEATLRVEKDTQLENAIADETKAREDNDITPGKYILESNEELTIPTNGADVANLQVSVADDFFNFGTF